MKVKLSFIFIMLSCFILTGVSGAQEEITAATQKTSVKTPASGNISLDIKGMDVIDVLKMLSARSGINLVIGRNVTGKVTLFLKEVDIWDAFEIVLAANELAYEKKGEIINVMTQRDYELIYGERYQDRKAVETVQLKYAKAADLSRALNQIKTNIGKVIVDESSNTLTLVDTSLKIKEMKNFIKAADLPIQTKVFNLNYAQAEKLNPKIQEIITKGVGSVKSDERTNKIVVTDFPEKLEEISKIIGAFDEKTPQVLIDAQIIEINPSDKFEMGVDWDYWLEKNVRLAASMPTSGAINKLSIGTAADSRSVSGKGEYKNIIDLLRTIGDTKILSSPRIMVLNNQEAKIHVGTKDAFITSTVSQSGTGVNVTSQSVNFVDVGIKLFVTPVINQDGYVTMKIRPEVSSARRTDIVSEGQITQIPIVSTSEAETTIMLKDGVTIIIGGLKKDEKTKTVKSIPILGNIPWLGALFRNTSDETETTELVILLTPHILSGATSYIDFAEIKPKDGAVAKLVKGNIVTERTTSGQKENTTKENMVNENEYYDLVTKKVKALALFDYSVKDKGTVKAMFTLSENGNLIGEPEILEAGNPALGALTVKAIKSACPFPAFPKSLQKTQESFKIQLSYE